MRWVSSDIQLYSWRIQLHTVTSHCAGLPTIPIQTLHNVCRIIIFHKIIRSNKLNETTKWPLLLLGTRSILVPAGDGRDQIDISRRTYEMKSIHWPLELSCAVFSFCYSLTKRREWVSIVYCQWFVDVHSNVVSHFLTAELVVCLLRYKGQWSVVWWVDSLTTSWTRCCWDGLGRSDVSTFEQR